MSGKSGITAMGSYFLPNNLAKKPGLLAGVAASSRSGM
jgi:hypothetical protein